MTTIGWTRILIAVVAVLLVVGAIILLVAGSTGIGIALLCVGAIGIGFAAYLLVQDRRGRAE